MPITYIIQRDRLVEVTRDGEFSLFPYYSMCLGQFLRWDLETYYK